LGLEDAVTGLLQDTRAHRRAQGKALRTKCPRSTHGLWNKRSRTRDPIDDIEESNADRIPGLIAVRYGRMAQSPISFFRGSAVIQARDLYASPRSGAIVQLCGDCHLMNFGGFATPERTLVFDINDFDETFPGPWEWDVKRLVVSLVLAARFRGLSRGVADEAIRSATAAYRERMAGYSRRAILEVWYEQIDIGTLHRYFGGRRAVLRQLTRAQKQAVSRTSEAVFPKLTAVEGGQVRIIDNPPLIYHFAKNLEESEARLTDFLARYKHSLQADRRQLFERYRFIDAALKVVGVGSVGTRCTIALFLADGIDPLFLQAKEARRSVLEHPGGASSFSHQGERIISGQRLMQAASDIFLGWAEVPGSRDYYVRQLRDMKVSAEVESFVADTLPAYGTMCGWALARAHAKAGDAATISGYLGASDAFDDALAHYAPAYADQVECDFEAFQRAIRSGRLHTDVEESASLDFLM
jgi:uncharacterized protein (DUF2252 family)